MLLICVHLQLDSCMNHKKIITKAKKKVRNDHNLDIFAVMSIARKIIITDLMVNYINISLQDCSIQSNLILFKFNKIY